MNIPSFSLFTVLTLVLSISPLFAQSKSETLVRTPVFTDNHQTLSGTELALIPPAGYVPGDRKGLLSDTSLNASIFVMSYGSLQPPFTVEFFRETMGATAEEDSLTTLTDLQINNLSGFLIETQNSSTNKYGSGRFTMTITDGTIIATILGSLPYTASQEQVDALREALLSILMIKE